ncbi:MAG: hypothetical protein WBM47_07380, partial [Polyangiales bacterium]
MRFSVDPNVAPGEDDDSQSRGAGGRDIFGRGVRRSGLGRAVGLEGVGGLGGRRVLRFIDGSPRWVA